MTDTRSLALLVLDNEWKARDLATQVEADAVTTALAELAQPPRSLLVADPDLKGEQSQKLRKWLKPIGMKSWPTLSGAAKSEWLDAMVLALSDLPAGYVIAAAQEAVHRPYRFPSEPEVVIREIVAREIEKRTLAVHRLRMLLAEIKRASAPAQPQLEALPKRWTLPEVQEANARFKKIGVAMRYELLPDGDVRNYSTKILDEEDLREDIGAGASVGAAIKE
jgi:hypothetical protein